MGELSPRGRAPIDVEGAGYYVDQAVQPDPKQGLTVALFGDADALKDARVVGLTAGPIHDRNGNPVPDGTAVTFSLAGEDGRAETIAASTVDGVAGAAAPLAGAGTYTATASVAGITSEPLIIRVRPSATSPEPQAPSAGPDSDATGGGAMSARLLAVILAPIALAVAGTVVGAAFLVRRRRPRVLVAVADAGSAAATQAAATVSESADEPPPRL